MTSDQTVPPKRVLQKKGMDLSDQDLKLLQDCIKRRGEAVPGEMALELGWARSSLAYNLNRLLKRGWIVRLGGGRSIRYRMATDEEWRAFRQQLANQESQKDTQPQKIGWAARLKKFFEED
jgi:DNA-binding MarR family transcriptional regulator